MYFLGHAAIAYLLNRAIFRNGARFSIPLLFAASFAPDLDFVMPVEHHTLTHSILFWLPVYAVLFAIYRRAALAYFIATLSHFLVGDVLVGSPPILLGITDARFSIFEALDPLAMSVIEVSLFAAMVAAGVNRKNFTIDLNLKRGRWDLAVLAAVAGLVVIGNVFVPGKVEERASDAAAVAIMAAGHTALLILITRSYWLATGASRKAAMPR